MQENLQKKYQHHPYNDWCISFISKTNEEVKEIIKTVATGVRRDEFLI